MNSKQSSIGRSHIDRLQSWQTKLQFMLFFFSQTKIWTASKRNNSANIGSLILWQFFFLVFFFQIKWLNRVSLELLCYSISLPYSVKQQHGVLMATPTETIFLSVYNQKLLSILYNAKVRRSNNPEIQTYYLENCCKPQKYVSEVSMPFFSLWARIFFSFS